ncbi:transglycosylase domain-containing protein [Nocardiopsis ansamitocini]|uniref:Penicillin-insensitive transglycosylase n=1 Tax=Nocardiopsis ansamitocini TaxID=1670832 RepID=A0A9W6P418_9ACTN|nr:transglycosylase domain-containing protein [Nocardiopsis ansamitocini]GLU46701.1 hypothetical protein Nans01_10520 [Nocardiopsis ansamitocini]
MDPKHPDPDDRPADGFDQRPSPADTDDADHGTVSDETEAADRDAPGANDAEPQSTTRSDAPDGDGDFGWFAGSDGAQEGEESPYLAASAFKDSGSFFRDTVARNLADQYGLSLNEDGSVDRTGTPGAVEGDEQSAAETDAVVERTDEASSAKTDGGEATPATAAERSDDENWDPEGTAEFRPVFDDDDDDDSPSAASAEPAQEWDPEGTAEFTPVFDDADDPEHSARSESPRATDDDADATAESAAAGSAAADTAATGAAIAGVGLAAGAMTSADRASANQAPETEDASDGADEQRPPARYHYNLGKAAPAPTTNVESTPAGAEAGTSVRAGSGETDEGAATRDPAGQPTAGDPAGTDEAAASEPPPERTADTPPAKKTGLAAAVYSTRQPETARANGDDAAAQPTADVAATRGFETVGAQTSAAVDREPEQTAAADGTGGAGNGPEGREDATGPKGAPGKDPKNKKDKKKKPLWWRITRVGLIAALFICLLVAGGFAYAFTTIDVPDATQADAVAEGSTITYADGSVIAKRGVNRDPVELDEVPEHVQNAILSAEDRGFWTEPGVSFTGTARAVWSTVSGNQVQGGSTITQQMVRNYYEGLSQEQSIDRKLKEIVISLKVDKSKSKAWVLEQYLNTIYFGRNAYGIQAAAEAYYHKDVGDLTPDEAAFLAAAIQQPTRFGFADSDTTPDMENRWQYVVNGLVTMESITPAEAAGYEFPKPEKERPMTGMDLSGYNGYMFQQAMKELEALGYTEDNINRGGFTITTTFDKDLMAAAKEAVEDNVNVDDLPEEVRIGLSAVDPATGEVVAFYGGSDYEKNQYDSAFLGTAQAGSSFKPFVLAAALKNGMGINTVVDGSGPQMIAGSRVQNAGNAPGGPMNLVQATTVSNNLGFIDLADRVGLQKVADTAYEMGLPEGSLDDHLVPVMPLGVNSVSPTDQAGAYATFANGGEHIETHVIRSITNREGEEERPEIESNRVLTEGEAADATYAMRNVVTSGTGTNAAISRPAAGKTGTTSDSVAAWFVGYTPNLAAASGVYNGNNQTAVVPGWGEMSSGGLPSIIWRDFMEKAAASAYGEYADFPQPVYGGSSENYAPAPPPQEEVPADDPSTDQPPVDPAPSDPDADAPPTDEPPVDDPSTDQPPVDPAPSDPDPNGPPGEDTGGGFPIG